MSTSKNVYAENIDVNSFNKAIRYIDAGKHLKAIALLKRIIKQGEFKEAWLNLGVAYKWVEEWDLVRSCFEKACAPDILLSDGKMVAIYDVGYNNLGLYHYTFEDDATAEKMYRMVLEDNPLNYDAIWNLAIVSLRKYCSGKGGSLERAWKYYSYRFKRSGATKLKNRKEDLIFWEIGEEHKDKSVVVLLEQGMGDAIMFGRYLKELQKYFDQIYVQCTPEMNYIFSDYNTCLDASETYATYAVPMCSLGLLMNEIPDGNWLAHKRIVHTRGERLNIGCVWSGNKTHINDQFRSCSAGYFDRLQKYGNLFTLGPNEPRKGYTHLAGTTWEDTIKNLGELDLVISIDSSIVHMCGSLDMPCWVLMPRVDTDFRWGDSSAEHNNLWYDSVDVFRNPNSWEAVFSNVEKRLCLI